jgi:predicted N-acetyltransferase YhbS
VVRDLDCHPASPDERVAAYRNVFDVWPYAQTLDEHVRRRLASVQHNRAAWFVGTAGGRVVTALASYELEFRVRGRVVPGIAIGSVHTLAECRGRGFAPRLIQHVEEHERRRGAKLSILYSDIGTAYYARLGYAACPSHEGWIDLAASGEHPASGPPFGRCPRQPPGAPVNAPGALRSLRLPSFNAADAAEELARHYDADHGTAPLCVHRSRPYWAYLLQKSSADMFLSISTADGAAIGYARIKHVDSPIGLTWRIHDLALSDRRRRAEMYGALLRLAQSRGAARLGGWMPNDEVSLKVFHVGPRSREITMLKPLDAEFAVDPALVAAADRFCEIDHV